MGKSIEVSVQVPEDLSWEKVTELEDDLSQAAGRVLKNHGLKRLSHKRRIEADYTATR